MLYISELCEDCAVVNEIDYEIDDAWTNIHGIHDNGPRDHGVWPSDFNSVFNVHVSFPDRVVWGGGGEGRGCQRTVACRVTCSFRPESTLQTFPGGIRARL